MSVDSDERQTAGEISLPKNADSSVCCEAETSSANVAVLQNEEVEISVEEEEPVSKSDIITQSMIDEEKKIHDEEEFSAKGNDGNIQSGIISVEERLDRLQLVLQKSKVYADLLLKVIEDKREAERKKALKRERIQKKSLKSAKDNSTKENVAPGHKKRQRVSDLDKRPSKRARSVKINSELDELLQSKLYLPGSADVVNQITERNGARYFGDQLVDVSQPTLFTGGVLRDYQVLGFQWLKVLFANAVNGILADEMGLGKTIQCIAMICHIVKAGFKGPFLVCAPLSTIANWINEFKTFAPSLPLLLYHGSGDERAILAGHIKDVSESVNCHPVVITSYEVLLRDRVRLGRYHWEYLILDEGHRIKNTNCRLLRELRQLRVGTKLLLTGTPLQNNLKELWSLLNFIIPEVFDDLQVFESWFDIGDAKLNGSTELSYDQEEKFLTTLYEILTPFLLRRVKSDVKIDLPPKSEVIVYAPFSQKQEEFYKAAVNKTIRSILNKDASVGFVDNLPLSELSNPGSRLTRSKTEDERVSIDRRKSKCLYADANEINVSLNNIMMLLRKCCNHPYLIEYPLEPGTDIFKVDEDLVTASGKLMVLDRILQKLKERGHKVLIFSQMTRMLDILEDYLRFRDYASVRLDGSTRLEERQKRISEYNTNPDIFVFLLSTRAGGLGINLTAADTVIIYDSDWNPQNDLQAQDRCHRIGQTRPVMVYRLVTASSIDQKMVERAADKRKLEKMVMHENKFKGHLDVELKQKMTIGRNDILQMIKSTDINAVVDSSKALSDERLEQILDRSSLTNP